MTSEQQTQHSDLFEQLFQEYQQPILNYVYRLLGDRARAEEVAQDAFVKAYRALPKLPAEANHRAWLYRIATNAAYDQLRRRKLIQWLPLLDNDRNPSAEPAVEGQIGEREAVQQALGKLPPKYRSVLVLFTVQGYSTQEIGEMLDISTGAVKTRLYRARELFRQAYGRDI